MSSLKFEVTCPNGHELTVDTGEDASNLFRVETLEILAKGQCPICGAEPLTAPGGVYEKRENGRMVRTGNFLPPAQLSQH